MDPHDFNVGYGWTTIDDSQVKGVYIFTARRRRKTMDSFSSPHAVLFPFMSKGHTIPILQLARLFLLRGVSVSIFTTPANSPFIRHSLADTQASIIDLPFPQHVPEIPAGVESTDKLPSISLFYQFANATKLIQPHFERALEALPSVSFMVSDGFLYWTQKTASKLGIPWLTFYGMNTYSMIIPLAVFQERQCMKVESDDELFSVSSFPWIKLTRNDFDPFLLHPEPDSPEFEFFTGHAESFPKSRGLIFNSFYDLEPAFIDYWNREIEIKGWFVGPLCMAEPPRIEPLLQAPIWMQWLDAKLVQGQTVLYVAFGSQAEIAPEQLKEMAIGLERSEANFFWVVKKPKGSELVEGFEERVKDRGLVVREWVGQREILEHKSVSGFMSHCGWNSVAESICAGVPILAWPMMAEQHLNARMVHEELGIGLRILASNGSVRGFVTAEIVESMVRELMEGEKGKEVRKKVKDVEEAAKRAVKEGGSSRRSLDLLIEEHCNSKKMT